MDAASNFFGHPICESILEKQSSNATPRWMFTRRQSRQQKHAAQAAVLALVFASETNSTAFA
jgi:hypothetical protein